MKTIAKKGSSVPVLCSLRNMNLVFGTKIIFDDANCAVNVGDKIGLLGPNGQGKSTLFKVFTEAILPNHSEKKFVFDKYQGGGDPEKAYSVFLVPQDLPHKNDPKVTIRDIFFVFYPDLRNVIENVSGDEMVAMEGIKLFQNFESYLKFWGLEDIEQKVANLSGGQQKKILLALGLSAKANLILWDEPTNHIDLESIKRFEDEIVVASRTYMIVTHDRYLLTKVTNKILQLRKGKIEQFEGNYTDYLDFLKEKELHRQKLLDKLKNNLRRESDWISRGVKARRTKSKKRIEDYGDLTSQIQKLKLDSKKEIDFIIASSRRKTKKLMEAIHIGFSYGDQCLFEDLSLTLHRGDKIGIIGSNGQGKTTLVKLLMGQLSPSDGEVKLADNLKIQYFSQDRSCLQEDKTPYQLLGEGNDIIHLPDGQSIHIIAYFESFLFNRDDIHRPLKYFSGGERGRLQMAMNLKRSGDVWIFDEPTNDLDLETLQILESKLEAFEGALILISHDRSFLETITNRVWVIEEDRRVTTFEAGYAHAAPYLEALQIEKEIELEREEEKKNEKKENNVKKMPNKKKFIPKKLLDEIKQLEDKLFLIEKEIGDYDFSQMDKEKTLHLQEMVTKKEEIEIQLMNQYEELERLNQDK